MKKYPPFLRLLLGIMILSLLLAGVSPASGQNGTRLFISTLDCSKFPTVKLMMRGLNAKNNIITADLLAKNYALFENDTPVAEKDIKPVGVEDGPKYVVFSFDLGLTAYLDKYATEIKTALHTFANQYFNQNGADTVRLVEQINYGSQETKDILGPTTKVDDLNNAIDNLLDLSPTQNELVGYVGLENLYNLLSAQNPGRYSISIVDFNRQIKGFASPDVAQQKAQTLGSEMADHNIRLYVFNTFDAGWQANPSLGDIVTLSGGSIVQFEPNDTSTQNTLVNQVYSSIVTGSQVYSIQFRAHSNQAKYSLAPKGGSLADATDSLSCTNTPPLPAPVVQITQPEGDNPVIFLKQNDKTVNIQAELENWPNDGSRHVATVDLYNGTKKIDSKAIPADSSDTTFNFDLDVSNVTFTATYNLHVRVTDEFGITGDGAKTIEVNPYKPVLTATPVSNTVLPAACHTGSFSVSCAEGWLLANLVWLLLGVLFIFIIILFITNRRLAKLTSPARAAVSRGIDQVRKTLLGGASGSNQPLAYLHVLMARPDRTGETIEITSERTSIGRDPTQTDVQLYLVDDKSSVSSLHCTIFMDQGKFFITDDSSTNGTFLNGNRLEPDKPYELPDGAEIILGNVARQGAKLSFERTLKKGTRPAATVEPQSDFSVDLPDDGTTPLPAPIANEEDDLRKTVVGKSEINDANAPESFKEPAPPSAPPAAPKPGQIKKPGQGKDWKDQLG